MAITFRHARLDNGLNIVAEVDSDAYTAAAGFFVKTGARDEPRELMGVSHFLEHMIFKGTERRTADDVNREFDDIGADYNAYTSHDMTAFYAHVLPEYLPQVLDLWSDVLRPALRETDFNTERNVILEEIAMYRDIPYRRLYDEISETHYRGHPLGYRVLGTNETIRDLKRDAMAAYFEKHYSAASTTLSLAGRVDFDQVVDEVNRLCGGWSTHQIERDAPAFHPEPGEVRSTDAKLKRTYLLMLAQAPGLQDDDRYAANMLAHLIGDHDGSLFYWSLVDPGLAEEAELSYNPHDGLGDFFIFAACSPERANEVEGIIDDQIARCFELVNDEDLERYRNKIATGVTLAGERPAGRMHRLGRLWTGFGEYRTLDEELARIQAVTLDDVRTVYDKYRALQPRTAGRLAPGTVSDSD